MLKGSYITDGGPPAWEGEHPERRQHFQELQDNLRVACVSRTSRDSRTSKQDAVAAVASKLARHATFRELSGRHPANGVCKLAIKARESCGVSDSATAEGASKLLRPSLLRLRASDTALFPGSPTLTIASAQKGSGSWPVNRIIPGNTSAAPGTPKDCEVDMICQRSAKFGKRAGMTRSVTARICG